MKENRCGRFHVPPVPAFSPPCFKFMTAIDQQRTTTGMPGWHAGLDRHDFICEPVALEPPRHATHGGPPMWLNNFLYPAQRLFKANFGSGNDGLLAWPLLLHRTRLLSALSG